MSETTDFWSGSFGDEYTTRCRVQWEERVPFWEHIIELTAAQSFLEVGVNAGWNLQAIRKIDKTAVMSGCDVNRSALAQTLAAGIDVEECEGKEVAQRFGLGATDLAFTCGVLIHIPPEDLKATMIAIRDVSSKYVLAVEYEAKEETEVEYRGHKGKLWKRNYGALYTQLGLSVVEFGQDAKGFDSCGWWLFSKE